MAIAFRPTHAVTPEELEELSRANPGVCFERSAQGQLIVSPLGTMGSSGEAELIAQLTVWARLDGRGFSTSSNGGFTLSDGSIFAPDAAWVSHERWSALSEKGRQGYARIAPDVAFELLSPSDTLREARAKASVYLENGTRLVVLLDPSSALVECLRPGGLCESHLRVDAVPLDPELPGFRLDAATIFARMERR